MEIWKRKKKTNPPVKQRLSGPDGGLGSFWFTAFIGIALLMAVGVGVLLYLEQRREVVLERLRLDLQVQALEQRLSQTLGLYHRMLRGLSTDPDLVRLFQAGGAAEREAREKALVRLLPDALRVRLLSPEHDAADLESDPPLSFASLSLLRAAESAVGPPPLEVFRAKTPKAHLVGVTAVRGAEGEPLGLVHVAFDPAPLRRWLGELTSVSGRIELQQNVEGNNVTLYVSTDAPPVSGDPDGLRRISGSLVRLAYWYRPGLAVNTERLIQGAGVLALLALLSGLLMGLQYRRMRRVVAADQALLIGLADDALAGHGFRRVKPQLREFGHTLDLLLQRLKTLSERTPGSAEAAEQTAAVAGSLPHGGESGPAELVLAELPEAIFQAYAIRGVVGDTLTDEVVGEIGRAIGSQVHDRGQQSVIVARDARASGGALAQALIGGLNATGRDVIDLGIVPATVWYFATHFLGSDCGVMVTGSHSPPEWNGLKVVMGGESLAGDELLGLRERVERGDLLEGSGSVSEQDLAPDYIERITGDVSVARPLKVVIDCAGGCAALVAPELFRALGCEVVELFCDLDAAHPGHGADPSRPENLKALREAVAEQRADIGLAFDEDGGRLGVVDSGGRIIWPDRLLMLLSADVLSRYPGGDVIFDVMCSRALASQILQNGGRPVMWKSDHALLQSKLRETGALLAGEWRGHIMFRERWYGFGDAMYAGARLLEILALDPRSSAEVFTEFPEYVGTPELLLPVGEGEQYEVMERAQRRVELLGGAKLTTIDGLRAEFEDGWGLIRASNTESALCFRFEADSEPALERIQGLYRALLAEVGPDLALPF